MVFLWCCEIVSDRTLRLERLLGKQIADSNLEGMCQLQQVQSRAIADTALDPAHVAAAEANFVGERLL